MKIRLKAVSVMQPWANRIVSGRKTIEVRNWRTSYRGPLLIVSSKKPPIPPAGYALAIATLIMCRDMTPGDEFAAQCPCERGDVAWVLDGPLWRLKPFPVTGALGIFEIERDAGYLWPTALIRGEASQSINRSSGLRSSMFEWLGRHLPAGSLPQHIVGRR